jgi:hypothetical protein
LPAFLFVDVKRGGVVDSLAGYVALDQFETKIQNILNPPTPAPTPASTPAPTATP